MVTALSYLSDFKHTFDYVNLNTFDQFMQVQMMLFITV